MNSRVDKYLIDGCGRCPKGGTPECKVHNWQEELVQLRRIILDCGLIEEVKWSIPCYTYNKSNILIMSAFKEYCALSFFKGSLLSDIHCILDKPGENTQSARLIKFTTAREIVDRERILKSYIYEAIEVERAGLKVEYKKINEFEILPEFQRKLDEVPELKTAFEALTPGRQRGYLIHFSQPKQSQTRESRIEKCILKILDGKGLYD